MRVRRKGGSFWGAAKTWLGLSLSVILVSSLSLTATQSASATGSAPTSLCRSTTGSGDTYESDATKNGFYTSDTSRGDAVTGIRIEPVFSKRMYVDAGAGFDANYIAYRITNNSGQVRSDIWVQLSGFSDSGVVKPASDADTLQQIPSLAVGASTTRYFLLKATGTSTSDQRHFVKVFQGLPASVTPLAACYTDIKGVQRSIAANANKVTAISIDSQTPALGQLLTVTVNGAPGTVGSGTASPPDLSSMAISPASNSKWPTGALRLEEMSVDIKGAKSASGCLDENSFDNGAIKTATYNNTLVIRSFSACVSNKSTYTATYKFRIIGKAAVDPVIKPVASISSGTQIKYTGSYPSTQVSIPLSSTAVPITVEKSYLSHTLGANNSTVNVTYRIVASSTSGTAQLDALIDLPESGARFVSATFTDATRTSSTSVSKTDVTDGSTTSWRFGGPFFASTSRSAVLTYVVQYDLASPAAGQTQLSNQFQNQAFGVSGSYVVGSSNLITGVTFEITKTDSGSVLTPQVTTFSTTREKSAQTVSFEPPSRLGVDVSVTLDGYSSSGLPLSYRTTTPDVCVLSQFENTWTLTTLSPGSCELIASQPGDTEFAAAPEVTRTITVLKGQVISSPGASFAGASTTTSLEVEATSKLPVTVVSLNTEVCTVAVQTAHDATTGKTVYQVTKGSVAGSCLLVASQPGNQEWGPAVDLEIIIGIGLSQTLSFVSPAQGSTSRASDSVSVVATSSANTSLTGTSRLPVSFRSASPSVCAVTQPIVNGEISSGLNTTTGNTTIPLTLLGAGTCVIVASQDGLNELGENSPYAPAADVTLSFIVQAVGTTAQTLSISANFTVTYGDAPTTLSSTSRKSSDSSLTNLLVNMASSSDACALGTAALDAGDTKAAVSFRSAGTCTITASQAGNNTYAAAQPVTMTITILPKEVTIGGLTITTREYDATTDVPLSGTPRLDGVVPGDTSAQISLDGTISTQYSTPDVGNTKSATLSGGSLAGTKTSSYVLGTTTLTGAITKKVVRIMATDQTIGISQSPQCLSFFSFGSLQGSDSLSSISCDFGAYDSAQPTANSYTITLQNPAITRNGQSVLSNYEITLETGTLTVTSLEVVTLEAPELEVVYGSDLTRYIEDLNTAPGLKAKNAQGQLVAGSVRYRLAGSQVNSQAYAAGEYTLEVDFTPASDVSNRYANANGTRTLKVIPRKLTTQVTAISKEYDGTRTAVFSGGTSLLAAPNGDGLGVLAGDDVSITGSVEGQFPSANAGENYDIPITGLALAGAKRNNYEFLPPATVRASITPKGLTVRVRDALKLTTDPDPTFAVDISGFIAGEGRDNVAPVVVTRSSTSNAVGRYTLAATGASSNNYRPAFTSGTLYVADIEITVEEQDSVLTDRTVTCNCTGLVPGETVSLTIYSDPTVIDSVIVPSDGTCPFANQTIPNQVPDGDHTLEVASTLDGTGGVALELPVILLTQPDPQIGGGGTDPLIGGEEDPVNDGSASVDDQSSATANGARSVLSVTGASLASVRMFGLVAILAGTGALIVIRLRRRRAHAA